MTGRRLALLAALAAVVVLAGGCVRPTTRWATPTSGNVATASPSTTSTMAPANWQPCPDVWKGQHSTAPTNVRFDCATVKVPQDWLSPVDGASFDVALVRARSVAQRDRVGSLLINPGGPGESGINYAVAVSGYLPVEITRRFDIVGFDPRGVGKSSPVKCFSDRDLDASFAADPDPVSQAQFEATVAVSRRLAQSCGDRHGEVLRFYSTEQTARDMDAIRIAIGESKLTYLGFSYGTLLGAVYAQLFPANVRALVLDGAIDPTLPSQAGSEQQAKGFERAFDNFAAWCRGNAGQCPVAPDARAVVMEALADARKAPVQRAGRSATAGWIFTAVVSSLYSESSWRSLAHALDQLRDGRPDAVFTLADGYTRRDTAGRYTNLFDANAAINCTDSDRTPTVEEARNLQEAWRVKYPLFGPSLALNLICAQWPGKRDPYPTGPATGAPPIVVIGTVGDPATPYEQAPALARLLGVGTLVTWQGEGHTAYPKTTCVREAVNRYLVDLKVPPENLTCHR